MSDIIERLRPHSQIIMVSPEFCNEVIDEITRLTAERDRALVQFVPEGWQLVPVALTEAMEQAIEDAWRYAPQNDMARREWGAALAAAPKPGDSE